MAVIPLQVPILIVRQIGREGLLAYPNECCGILLGRDRSVESPALGAAIRVVDRAVSTPNASAATEQHHRFRIPPLRLIEAEREADKSGRVVLGFYHSHPDQPARPSEYDRAHAWPFYSYVIVSVTADNVVDLTSWVLDDVIGALQRQEIQEGDCSSPG